MDVAIFGRVGGDIYMKAVDMNVGSEAQPNKLFTYNVGTDSPGNHSHSHRAQQADTRSRARSHAHGHGHVEHDFYDDVWNSNTSQRARTRTETWTDEERLRLYTPNAEITNP